MKKLSPTQRDVLFKLLRSGRAGVKWNTAQVLVDLGLIDRKAFDPYYELTPTGRALAEGLIREAEK